jgi:hypothetical protein
MVMGCVVAFTLTLVSLVFLRSGVVLVSTAHNRVVAHENNNSDNNGDIDVRGDDEAAGLLHHRSRSCSSWMKDVVGILIIRGMGAGLVTVGVFFGLLSVLIVSSGNVFVVCTVASAVGVGVFALF